MSLEEVIRKLVTMQATIDEQRREIAGLQDRIAKIESLTSVATELRPYVGEPSALNQYEKDLATGKRKDLRGRSPLIAAICAHRNRTGIPLKESKDAVDAYLDGKTS